ncbi:MAG: hypothetical protein L0211_09535 [Planctomycetaceae bacterium]|nr:hypothetical protein [Planctomycetaceae bacterium]
MSKLGTLRSQLGGLRRARSAVRSATAWSSLVTAVLWALAGVLVLDVLFELELLPRLVVLLLAAGAVMWAFVRYTRPLLGQAESEIDMALLVERQQQIDSDLVAAIQFESPEAARWGSPQLEGAVIDYVAAVGRGINVFEGFSRDQMTRRGLVLAITAVTLLVLAGLFPGHAAAFVNRLFLGSMHYPTRTEIDQIVISGKPVLIADDDGCQPRNLKAAQGRPLGFFVVSSGIIPAKGSVQFHATGASRTKTTVELRPLAEADVAKSWPVGVERPPGTVFTGEMPRLVDSVSYKVFLGDAWTDAARIDMVPLPTIETRLVPVPPRYAQRTKEPLDPTARQISVLERSSIDLAVQCTNNKPLASVKLLVRSGQNEASYDLAKTDKQALVWKLPAGKSPLANIVQEIRYEIQVTDADGLSLETPIRGTIRIRPDRPPTGSAEVVHKVVLPTAEPVVEYRATDDYGLSKLALIAEVERYEHERTRGPVVDLGQGVVPSAREVPVEVHRFDLLQGKPLLTDRLPLASRYGLSLSPLKLAKGDRVRLTLEVTDYRGENEQGQPVGRSHAAEGLVLEISDESGVLAAISQADERSEQRLTDIIKRQLGIGETP